MIINFIDPTAVIAPRTKVWHFAVILAGVRIDEECSIGSHCEIGRDSVIWRCTRIGNGVFIPPRSLIGKHCFIGPGVIFTDDKYPIAGNADYIAEPPIIEEHVSIGAGAIILPGIRIGAYAMIGAGAIVTKDVPEKHHVRGEPARTQILNERHRNPVESAGAGVAPETSNG